ncbi:ATP-binding protein [Pseudorhodoferax sp. LjRoot39]|uniref:ATP-binding protein n=1 Tax=Pseudorhodoferax sp. LjRoot39 TaxID=3342328 RepID=UPI003ECE0213
MMLQRLRAWLAAPSLVRRSTWSVLGAFFVVWAVLLGYQFALNQHALATGPNLQRFGHALADALADIDDADQARATLAATARWVNERRAADERLSGRYRFALADRDGRTVYASSGFAADTARPADPITHADIDGIAHRLFQASAGRWTLRIAEPRRTPSAFLAYNARFLLPYLLIAAPVVLLAVWLSVRLGLRPLQALADRIASRRDDDLQPVGFMARHRELRPLVQALDRLLASARQRLQRERAFVQDAAHELRTPLAVITAQAHVLARSPDASARVAAQQQLDQAIQRSAHLAQQLLDLAELDEAPRGTPAPVDVADHVRALMAQAAPAAMAVGVELALEAPEHLVWPVDLPALESVTTNLVDNAVRYAGAGCSVLVTLRAVEPGWSLTVQDDGPGIAPAEQARVFDRFYRGAGQAASGSGLGLAIVRQAALRLGGSVAIVPGLAGRGVGLQLSVPAQT